MEAPNAFEDEKVNDNDGTKDPGSAAVPLTCPTASGKNEKIIEKDKDDKRDIIRFTMLFNKYNSDLDLKRNLRSSDDTEKRKREICREKNNKCAMFFNKEVKVHSNADCQLSKGSEVKTGKTDAKQTTPFRLKSKFASQKNKLEFGKPHISEPGMMFSDCLRVSSSTEVIDKSSVTRAREVENLKKLLYKRNLKPEDFLVEVHVHPALRNNLRAHTSLTNLTKNNTLSLKGALTTKIPSMTSIETHSINQKNSLMEFRYWEHWDDLISKHNTNKRLNLQISKSSNDNSRRSLLKFKKEDPASVSDSKLLYSHSDKKQIKKCDKKSRGDSSKKEIDITNRKQVQWNTEVEVIYFSTHLASNGDRTGEVIGRVMEPLREEWEQQRKGFYAKMVPYYMENNLRARFISLLKI